MSDSRRRTGVVAALVVLVAVPAAVALAADPAPSSASPRLDLVWVDPTGIAGAVFPRVEAESRSILTALGTEVDWRPGDKGLVIGPESMAVIALPTLRRSHNGERHVMGATRRGADGALAVWVFPDQVAWAIGLDLDMRGSWGMRGEDAFARAVARVASHEVVHALGVPGHARGGLMSATLRREDLLAPSLRIDSGTIASVRRRFDGGPLLAAAGAATALADTASSPRRAMR